MASVRFTLRPFQICPTPTPVPSFYWWTDSPVGRPIREDPHDHFGVIWGQPDKRGENSGNRAVLTSLGLGSDLLSKKLGQNFKTLVM
ncbi:hypothetical protein PoB_004841900 [Plakobranchus ocellatus]|uniref:Uncharacterized protein n=1 Tax=Plakobranchus ocellatus TaxID=259542 RepID=A0AAV4BU78_9GAST|nr:hypothetical protein PoB_004841900 [Plakobranchus ocellatus]